LFYIIHMIRKRLEIDQMLMSLRRHFNREMATRMTKVSIVFVTLWLSIYIFDIMLNVWLAFGSQLGLDNMVSTRLSPSLVKFPRSVKVMAFVYWLYAAFLKYYLPMLMTLVYNYLIIAINLVKSEFLMNLTRSKLSISGSRRKWQEINHLLFDFEQLFNMIPFFNFCISFLEITSFFLVLNHNDGLYGYIFLWFNFIVYSSQTLSSLFIINLFDHKNRRHLLNYQKKCLTMTDHQQLISDIKETIDYRLTAWSLFDLNKSLILNFISALITFSILFKQLTD